MKIEINLENHLDEVKEFVQENKYEFTDIFDEEEIGEEIGEKAVDTFLEDLFYDCLNVKNEEIRNELIYFIRHKQNKYGFRGVVELINKFAK